MWMWAGCVVGVDQHVTIDEPVEEIRVHAVNAAIEVVGRPGPVTLDGAIGGIASGAPELVVGDGVLTMDVDCLRCGGRIEIGAPAETRLLVVLDHGAITVEDLASDTTLELGLGDVEVRGHGGPLSVDGGTGSQELDLAAVIGLETFQEEGSIEISVPPGGYALDLSPGTGEPSVDPLVTDDPEGPLLRAGTGGGRIEIRAR